METWEEHTLLILLPVETKPHHGHFAVLQSILKRYNGESLRYSLGILPKIYEENTTILLFQITLSSLKNNSTVFIQIDAHAQIDAHPSSSASSWFIKMGESDDFHQI